MVAKTLKFKVGLYLAVTLTTTLLLFAVLVVGHQRTELLEAAASHVNQLSDVIIRSTRFAMLKNQPDHVHSIIQDVARLEKIARVRIYSKEGIIIDSSFDAEIGQRVDRNAEGCSHCHQDGKARLSVPMHERSRIFETPDGRRMLASMEVIRNEPSCYTAACHAHKKEQSVLGVLDIAYPLERGEHRGAVLRAGGGLRGASGRAGAPLGLCAAARPGDRRQPHRLRQSQ